jgi:DNA-binding NarL/FixJ family response regulator
MLKVLLVDDKLLIRQALRALLRDEASVAIIAEATDGAEAVAKALQLRPDIVIMELALPVFSGFEATRQIRQALPETKVIILTARGDDPELVHEAVTAGASGYLSRSEGIADVIRAIDLVSHGEAALSRQAVSRLIEYMSRPPSDDSIGSVPEDSVLSEREEEVLALVAQGFSNREIAERLFVSHNTIHSHVRNILRKLNLTNRVQMSRYAERVATNRQAAAQRGRPPRLLSEFVSTQPSKAPLLFGVATASGAAEASSVSRSPENGSARL